MKKINTRLPWNIVMIIFAIIIVLALLLAGGYIWCQKDQELQNKFEFLDNIFDKSKPSEEDIKRNFLNIDEIDELEELEMIEAKSVNKIGYIKNIYARDGIKYIEIDYIQWLQGDEALQAMHEDGECDGIDNCFVPNDYYIRNPDTTITTHKISQKTSFTMQTYKMLERGNMTTDEKLSYSNFASIFTDSEESSVKFAPYHLTLKNHIIVAVTEQYVP